MPHQVRQVELLWPYPPESGRRIDNLDVVVELADGSRWMCAFHDTARYNQGVRGFRGLGPEQPYRIGPRLVIVREISEETVRRTVELMLQSDDFEEAFERFEDGSAES